MSQARSEQTPTSSMIPGPRRAATAVLPKPKTPTRVDQLPPWKVLLHNDSVNEIGYVVETIIELVKVNPLQALVQTLEAHKSGIALLITTHRERAELLCEQFACKQLKVTAEPER
jgi:ATP-dependent Clp protease adapter protein ClpS